MPKDRFYRLPREKVEAIRQAALREFKRVPLEEASINRIIRDADISRGSFYTYFEDKKELLKWLIDDAVKETRRFYVRVMLENKGDVWDLFEKMLDNQLDLSAKDGLMEVFANLMKSNAVSEVFQIDKACGETVMAANDRLTEWLYNRRDTKKCPLDKEQFRDLMEMQMLSLIVSMKQYFRDGLPREKVKEIYLRRLDMVHYGVCRQNVKQLSGERQE